MSRDGAVTNIGWPTAASWTGNVSGEITVAFAGERKNEVENYAEKADELRLLLI